MNYAQIGNELLTNASAPVERYGDLYHKVAMRKLVKESLGAAGYGDIADKASAEKVPYGEDFDFSKVSKTAAVIGRGKDAIELEFQHLLMHPLIND
ncbi:hypothetical protein [Pseudomonas sp. Xaverov 83]|uniref:hypothetical protein n=1 Tax=Pseudomonas sp. Xaverov 83 TaxID=2666087 RepID=UPI001C5A7E87|nr:hypothetical protein [Pseudomonas sp. Xaverov 83]